MTRFWTNLWMRGRYRKRKEKKRRGTWKERDLVVAYGKHLRPAFILWSCNFYKYLFFKIPINKLSWKILDCPQIRNVTKISNIQMKNLWKFNTINFILMYLLYNILKYFAWKQQFWNSKILIMEHLGIQILWYLDN